MNFIHARHPSLVKRFVQMLFSKMDMSVMRKWHSDNAVPIGMYYFWIFPRKISEKNPQNFTNSSFFLLLKRGENSLVLLFFSYIFVSIFSLILFCLIG